MYRANHVHYLLEPLQPEELPKIMHWLNWYTAMCFNRILNRTGHFWEKRYYSSGFANNDYQRTLNTLRYIHSNPKAAGIKQGFFYGKGERFKVGVALVKFFCKMCKKTL